jgi:hypothetical protein
MAAEEIHQIVATAAKNNAENGITGILMASGRIFFQIIEGPEDEINRLWQLIRHDPRHTDIILLNSETGSFNRLYPNWSMRGMVLDAESELRSGPLEAIVEMIIEWEKRKKHLISTLEFSLLAELSRIEKMTDEK